uniref:Uncharacterized protein n=1 Tax=Neospora caninum (strain Liverpool) TaxID=572307 RepID=A0A0F7UP89_NEOCL|nr:TPA: hypothetical protein BN1204_065203_1 [Neospora caninum Liverpool]
MGIMTQVYHKCRCQSVSLVRGTSLGFRPSNVTCCTKHVFFVLNRRVICVTLHLCFVRMHSSARFRIHRRCEQFETRRLTKAIRASKASPGPVSIARLSEFIENDGSGIGKVPLRLATDIVPEEHERTVAAAAPAEAQAAATGAGFLVPTSRPGSEGRTNHSAGGNRAKAGKAGAEASSGSGSSSAGNKDPMSPGAVGGMGSSPSGSVPTFSAGPAAKEKMAAGSGVPAAKGGAGGVAPGVLVASSFPDMTAAQVLDWVLQRTWVKRDAVQVEQALEKFYVDAQTRLAQGKATEATKMATMAIRLARILEERQAEQAREVAENTSTMSGIKGRKTDLFW